MFYYRYCYHNIQLLEGNFIIDFSKRKIALYISKKGVEKVSLIPIFHSSVLSDYNYEFSATPLSLPAKTNKPCQRSIKILYFTFYTLQHLVIRIEKVLDNWIFMYYIYTAFSGLVLGCTC